MFDGGWWRAEVLQVVPAGSSSDGQQEGGQGHATQGQGSRQRDNGGQEQQIRVVARVTAEPNLVSWCVCVCFGMDDCRAQCGVCVRELM